MAITHNDVQVTWPTAANSLSVSASSNGTSEEVTVDTTAIEGMLHFKCDNAGTPGSDSQMDFYILYTGGDPDGASTDEFDTTGHAARLVQLDTNTEDPALKSVPISVAAKKFKIYAVNSDATNAQTVSCTYTEVRG